jgi:hypothetical protein
MREVDAAQRLGFADVRIDFNLPLRDLAGDIRYRLICRGGDRRRLDRLHARLGMMSYVGDFTCILNPGGREGDASLLSEDGSSAHHSRGAFYQRELVGACAAYPEYGRIRNFRLRGFALTLAMTDVEMQSPGRVRAGDEGTMRPIRAATFTARLRRDATARTAGAERPGYLDPMGNPGQCRQVRRGNAPRMCRNRDTFSWERCLPGSEYEPLPWEKRPY